MTPRLRVLIAEDDYETREFLIRLLRVEFEIVGAVPTGRELVRKAIALLPDIIVSDTSMPLLSGIGAMNELQSAGTAIPIVLISTFFRRGGISRHPGALAYVDKSDLATDLIPALRHASLGQTFISQSILTSAPLENPGQTEEPG